MIGVLFAVANASVEEMDEMKKNKNDGSRDVKPGHDRVKEYHMHPYWFQNNRQQVRFTREKIRNPYMPHRKKQP